MFQSVLAPGIAGGGGGGAGTVIHGQIAETGVAAPAPDSILALPYQVSLAEGKMESQKADLCSEGQLSGAILETLTIFLP